MPPVGAFFSASIDASSLIEAPTIKAETVLSVGTGSDITTVDETTFRKMKTTIHPQPQTYPYYENILENIVDSSASDSASPSFNGQLDLRNFFQGETSSFTYTVLPKINGAVTYDLDVEVHQTYSYVVTLHARNEISSLDLIIQAQDSFGNIGEKRINGISVSLTSQTPINEGTTIVNGDLTSDIQTTNVSSFFINEVNFTPTSYSIVDTPSPEYITATIDSAGNLTLIPKGHGSRNVLVRAFHDNNSTIFRTKKFQFAVQSTGANAYGAIPQTNGTIPDQSGNPNVDFELTPLSNYFQDPQVTLGYERLTYSISRSDPGMNYNNSLIDWNNSSIVQSTYTEDTSTGVYTITEPAKLIIRPITGQSGTTDVTIIAKDGFLRNPDDGASQTFTLTILEPDTVPHLYNNLNTLPDVNVRTYKDFNLQLDRLDSNNGSYVLGSNPTGIFRDTDSTITFSNLNITIGSDFATLELVEINTNYKSILRVTPSASADNSSVTFQIDASDGTDQFTADITVNVTQASKVTMARYSMTTATHPFVNSTIAETYSVTFDSNSSHWPSSTPTFSNSGMEGLPNYAFETKYEKFTVSTTESSTLDNLSISFWMYDPTGLIDIYYNTSSTKLQTLTQSGNNQNNWVFQLIVKNGSAMHLYTNGVLKTTIASGITDLHVFMSTGTHGYFRYTDVRLYSWALSEAEIGEKYNGYAIPRISAQLTNRTGLNTTSTITLTDHIKDPTGDVTFNIPSITAAPYPLSASAVNSGTYYETTVNTWSPIASMSTGRFGLGVGTAGGKLYAIGGFKDDCLTTNEEYNPSTNTWTPMTSMSPGRSDHAVVSLDDKIYAIGGSTTGSVYQTTNQMYNPSANTWTPMASMSTARQQFGAVAVENYIYAIGGYGNSQYIEVDGNNILTPGKNHVERYDPGTGTGTDSWTYMQPMPEARWESCCVAVGTNIYVIGGINHNSSGWLDPVNEVLIYNTLSNLWSPGTPLPIALTRCRGGVIDGKIYVAGGIKNDPSNEVVNTLYMLDPTPSDGSTPAWTQLASMSYSTSRFAAGVINNSLYVLGGNSFTDTYISECEVFTTSTIIELLDSANTAEVVPPTDTNNKWTIELTGVGYKLASVEIKTNLNTTISGIATTPSTSGPSISTETHDSSFPLNGCGIIVRNMDGSLLVSENIIYDNGYGNLITNSNKIEYTAQRGFSDNVSNITLSLAESWTTTTQAIGNQAITISFPNPLSTYTMSFWMKTVDVAVDLYVASTPVVQHYHVGQVGKYTNTDNNWKHITVTGDGTTQQLWVFGTTGTQLHNSSWSDSTQLGTDMAGLKSALGAHHKLYFCDLMVWNRVLTSTEVNDVYTATATNFSFENYKLHTYTITDPTAQDVTVITVDTTGSTALGVTNVELKANIESMKIVKEFTSSDVTTGTSSETVVNAWSTIASLSQARSGLGVGTAGGKLYAVGGQTIGAGAPLGTHEEYDPDAETWSSRASLSPPRFDHAVVGLNDKIYAIGGVSYTAYQSANHMYDPSTNTWSSKASMPTGRQQLAAVAVGNSIYAIGGYLDEYLTKSPWPNGSWQVTRISNHIEKYDPDTNLWTSLPRMTEPRHDFCCVAVGTNIYVIGGRDHAYSYRTEVFVFNTASEVWSTLPSSHNIPLGLDRVRGGVINGKIYLAAGLSTGPSVVQDTLYMYDPTASTGWEQVTQGSTSNFALMSFPRYHHAAGVINNKLYVVGGKTFSTDRNECEVFTTSTIIDLLDSTNTTEVTTDPLDITLADSYNVSKIEVTTNLQTSITSIGTKATSAGSYDTTTGTLTSQTSSTKIHTYTISNPTLIDNIQITSTSTGITNIKIISYGDFTTPTTLTIEHGAEEGSAVISLAANPYTDNVFTLSSSNVPDDLTIDSYNSVGTLPTGIDSATLSGTTLSITPSASMTTATSVQIPLNVTKASVDTTTNATVQAKPLNIVTFDAINLVSS